MWQAPTGVFDAKVASRPVEPAYRSDKEKKKQFGIALTQHEKPFDAGLAVFPDDTNAAMWVSFHWLSDPIVIEAKEQANICEKEENLLDREQLAVKLLKFAEEKDQSGRFYLCEPKDRLAAYHLYAKIQGFVDKINIDASTNNFTNNELKITLVPSPKKEEKETKVIDVDHNSNLVDNPLPINLKLVR